ncbi:hypothetical protein K443DRAFT_96532 [Laccaria amethystina LaAM-08-1]|uniref:Uncharacterized protein n=1 Tax=Laccaria amethystina LaAM-08-1 TaxID=1095629 RepID=A0A0C9Y3A7_9AGAR|nr:hypothetical protein K443DRAFT_96532 [Laccaria amethystina LaAM-08-1]
MTIVAGQYLIRNKAAEAFVQRGLEGDKSLLPKKVISIPPGVRAKPSQDGDFYVLKANGAPAFSEDGLVFVSLLEDSNINVKWRITAVPHVGHNVYLPRTHMEVGYRVLATAKSYTQVAFRPLIVGPSFPPFYPPTQLWIISPFDNNQ